MIVLLDAGPLGLLSNPSGSPEALQCKNWVRNLTLNNVLVMVSEIADYEIRRELLRAKKVNGVKQLDLIKQSLAYAKITTEVMLKAAELWAWARTTGQQTASNESLDADVILAAQAILMALQGEYVVIATTNVSDLARYTPAKHWKDINI